MKQFLGSLGVLCAFFAGAASQAAPCGPFTFTPPNQVSLKSDAAMIVTHPSTLWDGRFSSKSGMDAAVKYGKKHNMPIIYLEGSDNAETYFFADCEPTYWVQSFGGEFNFAVETNHIYSVGGHWEACQSSTMYDLIEAWQKKSGVDLTITEVMDGIYSYGNNVHTGDSYKSMFDQFINIVTYRNKGVGKFKLNLMEMMGIIHDNAKEIEFVKRQLPPYLSMPKEYEVQLHFNGKLVEVLRPSSVAKPSVLKIEFIDSLYESGYAPAGL
jgi:hypothetical protein